MAPARPTITTLPAHQALRSWILAVHTVLLALLAGCDTTTVPTPAPAREALPRPTIEVGEASASPPTTILAWPLRNDAGADLLFRSDTAILRFHPADRDTIAARLATELMSDLDAALRAPLAAGGQILVERVGEPERTLADILADAGADALLTARILAWQRPALDSGEGVAVWVSAEVQLVGGDQVEPLWRWRIERFPLRAFEVTSPRKQLETLFAQAGRTLAGTLAGTLPGGAE